MSHIFLQQDPKTSVGDNDDVSTTIPTPEQLGSFLFTHLAGTIGKIYCAVLVAGVPTWVLAGFGSVVGLGIPIKFFSGLLAGVDDELAQGYMADTGNLALPATNSRYPAGPVGFTVSEMTVSVPPGENSMATDTTVVVLHNGSVTGLAVTIPTTADGQFSIAFSTVYAPGDYLDVLVSSESGGTGNTIRLSVLLSS